MPGGQCPDCGNESLNYGPLQIEGEEGYYPFSCPCGFEGCEWYSMDFSGYTDREGAEIEPYHLREKPKEEK